MSLSSAAEAPSFDLARGWTLSPEVALRPEKFGALAYHYGNRRLVFLKSPELVALVEALGSFDSVSEALQANLAPERHASYAQALARLADSEVLVAR